MTRRTDPRSQRTPRQQLPAPMRTLPAFTPVPRRGKRHDGWTDARQHAFIEALADTGSVEAACRAVDMSQAGAYYLRRQPGADSFAAAWQAALDLGVQRIEDTAPFPVRKNAQVELWGPRAQRRAGTALFLWQADRHPHEV